MNAATPRCAKHYRAGQPATGSITHTARMAHDFVGVIADIARQAPLAVYAMGFRHMMGVDGIDKSFGYAYAMPNIIATIGIPVGGAFIGQAADTWGHGAPEGKEPAHWRHGQNMAMFLNFIMMVGTIAGIAYGFGAYGDNTPGYAETGAFILSLVASEAACSP